MLLTKLDKHNMITPCFKTLIFIFIFASNLIPTSVLFHHLIFNYSTILYGFYVSFFCSFSPLLSFSPSLSPLTSLSISSLSLFLSLSSCFCLSPPYILSLHLLYFSLATLTLMELVTHHLDQSGTFIKILLMDFSSAFNTLQTHLLLWRFLDLDVSPSIVLWVRAYRQFA